MIAIRWKGQLYGANIKYSNTLEINLVKDVMDKNDTQFYWFKRNMNKLKLASNRQMTENEAKMFDTSSSTNLLDYLNKRWSDYSSIIDLGYYIPTSDPTFVLDLDQNTLFMKTQEIKTERKNLINYLNKKLFDTIF